VILLAKTLVCRTKNDAFNIFLKKSILSEQEFAFFVSRLLHSHHNGIASRTYEYTDHLRKEKILPSGVQ